MEDLAMCRVCLTGDVRLRLIANTHLQEMYESLTLLPLETKDNKPIHACYICCAGLQNCYRLRKRCHRSEELLTRILSSDVLQQINVQEGCAQRLKVEHPVIHLSFADVVQNNTDDDTTKDSPHRSEATDAIDHDTVKPEDSEDIKMEPQGEHDAQIGDDIQCSLLKDPLDVIEREPHDVETDAEDIKLEIEDIAIEDNETNYGCQSSLSTFNICPKIVKVVLERMVLNDTIPVISVPAVKKIDSLLATKPDTINKVDSTLHEHRDNTVMAHYEVHEQTIKKDYRSNARLECHTRIHTGKKRFPCDVCNKYFTHKHNLSRHMSIHTGEKRFQCNLCNKSFRSKDNLNQHMFTHTGEKLFQCNVCNKSFRCKHHLTQHMYLHTGEKRFRCHLCNKSFSCKHHLKKHMYTHSGEKQYQCDTCNKSFRRKHQLTRHMYTHASKKRFQCNMCNESFFSKYNLIRHMYTHE